MRWAKHACTKMKVPIDGECLRNVLGDAISFIRFPANKGELFYNEEKLKTFINTAGRNFYFKKVSFKIFQLNLGYFLKSTLKSSAIFWTTQNTLKQPDKRM